MSNIVAYDMFQGDFKPTEYVSRIVASIKPSGEVKNSDFDPVPLINCFESNMTELKKFYLTIEKRVEQLTSSLESEQGEVNQKISTLGLAFDDVVESFNELDQVSDAISATALRIGKQLQSIQNERDRALDAREIVEFFLEFNSNGKCAKLDALSLSSTFDSKITLAALLKKLYYIGTASIPGTQRASDAIKSSYSKLETETLTDFMTAFDEENISAMKDSASILVTLNDASSCIKVFIDKHAFFQHEYDCSGIKSIAFGPDNQRLKIDFVSKYCPDSTLLGVFDQILSTTSADWKYLGDVFDDPRSVMDQLLKRAFHDIITRHIDEGLKQSGQHSTAQFLRYLSFAYTSSLEFIDRLILMYKEHMDDLSVTAIENAVEHTKAFLLGLHGDIFNRYTRPQDIQALEARLLKEILDICAIPIANQINSKKAAKAAKNLFNINTGTEYKPVTTAELAKRCQFYTFGNGYLLLNPEVTEQGIIELDTFKRLLLIVAEAINRFSSFFKEKHELSDLMENYLSFFLETLRKQCILPSFQFAVENEDLGATSKTFDPRNLLLIQTLNALLSAMQIFFEEQIIPTTALVSPVCCRKAFEMKNVFFEACLRYINKTIRAEMNGISGHLSAIAQKYLKKTDYKPRPDDLAAFNTSTQFCLATREYLRSVNKAVQTCLPASNTSKFLVKVGKILFDLLAGDLIKKLGFNDVGALVLLNDINAFAEVTAEFGSDCQRELAPYFGFLREIANILMVKPENLRAVVQEGTLNLIDVRLLYPFMALRSDFKSSRIEALFPDMVVNTTTTSNSTSNPLSLFQ